MGRSQPWKMRMFKRYPFYWRSELDKKSPWKMRMFKRYSDYGGYGYGGGYGGGGYSTRSGGYGGGGGQGGYQRNNDNSVFVGNLGDAD